MKSLFQQEINLINTVRNKSNYVDTISLQTRIRDRRFTVKDIGVNYRWINHWHTEGLLLEHYEEGKWRKFNLIEYVWIKIILQIRGFNMSLKTVSKLKEMLVSDFKADILYNNPEINLNEIISQFAPQGKSEATLEILKYPEIQKKIEGMTFNLLEVIILDILMLGNCYSILMNSEGEVIPIKFSYLELISDIPEFKNLIYRSFVSISVTEILRDFIIEKELSNKNRLVGLTDEEMEVIKTIQKDNLKSVIIKFSENRKINLLEEIKETKVDKAARLTELIMTKGYQDITLKVQNGEIVYCENKMKRMIGKK